MGDILLWDNFKPDLFNSLNINSDSGSIHINKNSKRKADSNEVKISKILSRYNLIKLLDV